VCRGVLVLSGRGLHLDLVAIRGPFRESSSLPDYRVDNEVGDQRRHLGVLRLRRAGERVDGQSTIRASVRLIDRLTDWLLWGMSG
jgi:hypothetical protein